MSCCRCLNKNAHPEDAKNCDERCGFCLGYCSPVAVTIIVVGLIISNLVYFALLISRNKNSAWRIVLSIIFILIPIFCGACVLWAYYVIIFTSPGYVPRDPWQYRPRYTGDGPGPELNDGVAGCNAAQHTSDVPLPQMRAYREDGERWGGEGAQAHGPRAYPTEDGPPPPLLYSDKEGKPFDAKETPTTSVIVVGEGTTGRAPASGKLSDPRSHSPFDPATNPNPISDTRTATASPTAAGVSASSSPTPRSDPELNPYAVKMLDRKFNFRYCHSCRMYKPDLAHHCSVCGKCVFNFDHHCPYVNNCVGRNNYKVFLVFVLYGSVGCLLALVCAVLGIFVIDRDTLMTKIGWIAIPAVELVLGLALLCFFVQHRCLVSDGETTLDSIIKNQTRSANGWNYWKKTKISEEEKAAMEAAKQAKVKAHHDVLFGDEHPWYIRYLPIPVRTDDTAEDTIKQA